MMMFFVFNALLMISFFYRSLSKLPTKRFTLNNERERNNTLSLLFFLVFVFWFSHVISFIRARVCVWLFPFPNHKPLSLFTAP